MMGNNDVVAACPDPQATLICPHILPLHLKTTSWPKVDIAHCPWNTLCLTGIVIDEPYQDHKFGGVCKLVKKTTLLEWKS